MAAAPGAAVGCGREQPSQRRGRDRRSAGEPAAVEQRHAAGRHAEVARAAAVTSAVPSAKVAGALRPRWRRAGAGPRPGRCRCVVSICSTSSATVGELTAASSLGARPRAAVRPARRPPTARTAALGQQPGEGAAGGEGRVRLAGVGRGRTRPASTDSALTGDDDPDGDVGRRQSGDTAGPMKALSSTRSTHRRDAGGPQRRGRRVGELGQAGRARVARPARARRWSASGRPPPTSTTSPARAPAHDRGAQPGLRVERRSAPRRRSPAWRPRPGSAAAAADAVEQRLAGRGVEHQGAGVRAERAGACSTASSARRAPGGGGGMRRAPEPAPAGAATGGGSSGESRSGWAWRGR